VGRKVDPEQLVGIAEIADLLGVPANTVRTWKRRGVLPPPVRVLRQGGVWVQADVVAWARRVGRMPEG
jgi:predicted site-specific integrase-resolvase